MTIPSRFCATSLIASTLIMAQTYTVPGNPVVVSGKLGVGTNTPVQQMDVRSSTPNAYTARFLGINPPTWAAYGVLIQAEGDRLHGPNDPILNVSAGDGPKLWVQKDGSIGLGFYAHQVDPSTVLTLKSAYPPQDLIHGRDANGNAVFSVDGSGNVYSRGVRLGPAGSVVQGPPGPPGQQGIQGLKGDPGGITSLNSATGVVSLVAGANVKISRSGSIITISAAPGCKCTWTCCKNADCSLTFSQTTGLANNIQQCQATASAGCSLGYKGGSLSCNPY